ncbi:MAG: DUF6600 domain-containing protein [Vicinamibacterales bacterium]
MRTRLGFLGVAVACCCLPFTASAQDIAASIPDESPASLAYADGTVDLDHEGVATPADAPSLLIAGDRLRTARGRAEVVYGDGSVLHLDDYTEIELLDPIRIRLLEGRVILHASAAATSGYLIDTPASSVRLDARGEYGLTVDGSRGTLDIAVARGVAELLDEAGGRAVVRGGERASVDGPGARPLLARFNTARWDAFERWSQSRVEGVAVADAAGRLPAELRAYGPTLDRYGRWGYLEPYGYVWYPAVGTAWRPYYDGGWRLTRYGWTWYGSDPWSWPTHHYGRWGYSGASWYWIPARGWSAAWVSWGFSSGYVSWCPLGWNGRPVVSLAVGISTGWDPWRAWTVIPRRHFGTRGYIRSWAIDPRRTRGFDSGRFEFRDHAPVPAGHAVPRTRRAEADLSRDRAVPRGGARAPLTADTVGTRAGRGSGPADDGRATRETRGAVPRGGPPQQPRPDTRSWDAGWRTSGGVRNPAVGAAPRAPSRDTGAPDATSRTGGWRTPSRSPRDLSPRVAPPDDLTPRTAPRGRDLTPRTDDRPTDLTPRTRERGAVRRAPSADTRGPARSPGPPRGAGPSREAGPAWSGASGSRRSPGAVQRAPAGGGSSARPSSGGGSAQSGSRSGGSRRPNRRPPG